MTMITGGWDSIWNEIKQWPRWQMPEYEAHELRPHERHAIIKGVVAITVIGLLIAVMEINIEGAHGWARDLPCWRPAANDVWYVRVWSLVMGDKPMDGYHVAAFALWDFLFLLPFFFGVKFSWRAGFAAVMWMHLMPIFEDFQWFVWNGHYGLARFDAAHIPWHTSWIGLVPTDYPIMIGKALVFSLFASHGLKGGLKAVGLLLFATATLVALSLARG